MRRVKRRTSALQAAAVAAICILFVTTARVGLYKCFSKEPEPRSELPQAAPDPKSAMEPEGDAAQTALPSARARKERFHTILVGGLDDENGTP